MGKKILLMMLIPFLVALLSPELASAAPDSGSININLGGEEANITSSVKMFLLVAVLSLAPYLFLMLTCFTHVVIVLSIARQGLGTMSAPPNQVLIGLAIFITFFIMNPVITEIHKEAWVPLDKGDIEIEEAYDRAEKPLKEFMIKNTYEDHIQLFLEKQDLEVKKAEDVPMNIMIPASILSQIQKGLVMGVMVYIALSVIDMIVAAILMFMGMFMLPPQMLSLPLKILIFIFIGGFTFIIELLFQAIKT